MNKFCKVLLAAAAMAALAAPAMAANKLIVRNATNTADVFTVDDTGAINNTIFMTTDGKVGFGGIPTNAFDVFKVFPGQSPTNLVTTITTIADQGRYTFRRANGTLATPTALLVNQNIANLNFRGHNGTDWNAAASAGIVVQADETFTPTTGAARMMFFTQSSGVTPTGGTERLRISADGRLRISGQPAAPANNATCTTGDLILDAAGGFLYLCTGTNSWKRTAFSTY